MRIVIKKDLTDNKQQLIEMYQNAFGGNKLEAENVMTYFIDLKQSYGGYINNKLVSVVCAAPKKIIDVNEQEYEIVNVCAVMTLKEFQNQGYASEILTIAFDDYASKYDSVVIQALDWSIYKKFDLVDTTIKYEYEYIEGNYPVPMLMTWYQPNDDLIDSIDVNTDNNLVGLINSPTQIAAKIEMFIDSGCQFVSNPFAYIWFNKKNEIKDLNYNNLAQLTWLLHQLKPTNKILLFEQKLPDGIDCLKPTRDDGIVVTKTYAKSKHFFKNIKLMDFMV